MKSVGHTEGIVLQMIVHNEKAAVTAAFLITIKSSSRYRDLVRNQATEPGCGTSLQNLAMKPGRETTPPGYRTYCGLLWHL